MLVIADENMPQARTLFERLGTVRLAPGRAMTPDLVRDADLLMIRSVTKAGPALLAGSRVRFVGTATIGTDHVDQAWLAGQGIGFASAPGCNAEGVAQYVGAALAWAAGRQGRPLSQCSLGVVGVGNCGRRTARVARALGMQVILNDPPLARRTGDPHYRPLDELMHCDFVVLHVPLTRDGEDATWRLFDARVLDRLKPGAVLVNACRGFVADEAALIERVDRGRLGAPILDAWEDEPAIHPEMLARAQLATPHIAGYSHDGKVNGTRMIYEAACAHLGLESAPAALDMPAASVPLIALRAAGRTLDSVMAELMLTAYPIGRDDADLRCAGGGPAERLGEAFDGLRKHYPLRREFAATTVRISAAPVDWPADWAERIRDLGFTLETGAASQEADS